ncbi:MAG: Peptidyl-prolyl cis-trans isomerase Mip precursor [Candidatus Hydrogenedentes bacterium ADurb.Bin101]|jgi:FKBP-type peptidyl-prolyl cis-trans isomerase|nr:FKBP-type peptidyl-prolyl cis-trans isomerase [Candidatus Hydrogenedentota bacterium]OQC06437.1 MAG: Peptidyl-prolyl cis-trans isomerase Mip precursor [Candidatus Hydrogenedentes bacterium ADurb.Bin101]HOC70400.1 FKBP-type peptidyl-prolyl cis-trans isomerase [Candidatus Hydrogenedentota bacterium]
MKFQHVLVLLALAALGLVPLGFQSARAEDAAPAETPGTEAGPAKEPSTTVLATDVERISYIIGLRMGEGFKKSKLELDVKTFVAAIEDVLKDRQPAMTEEEMMATEKMFQEKMMQEQQAETANNLESAKTFLAENGKKEGVITTESGLQYIEVKPGQGEKPAATSKVRVHYKGSLLDGTEFDSSYKRGEPAEFQVDQVIPGWQEALQLMQVGAQYKLFIPPDLGYGDQGNPRIPGNSLLLFDVELVEIVQ